MSAVTRDETCVSNYALDRWVAGELSHGEQNALQEHLERCARCSLRCDEVTRHREAFFERVPSWDALASGRGHTPGRASRSWATPLLAAVAVAVLGVGVAGGFGSREQHGSLDGTIRTKGGPSIGFFVKRGEQIRRGSTGEVVAPGELLRFTYSSEQPAYFALLHADSHGANIYYPTQSDSARIAGGRDVPLDFSIRLDDLLGIERLYGVFCEQSIPLEPVRTQLERAGRVPNLPGCRVDPLILDKRSP